MIATLGTIEDATTDSTIDTISSRQRAYQMIVEVDENLGDKYVTHSFDLPASSKTTSVTVTAVADASQARRGASETYLAAIRRRDSKNIKVMYQSLDLAQSASSIMMQTMPILELLQKLILQLHSSDREANSREVLRQVRETLLDGQWKHYLHPNAKDTFLALMGRLAEAGEVDFHDTVDSAEKLEAVGFSISGMAIPVDGETE